MIKLPDLNKRNWKKILRELDINKFPSLPEQLKNLRQSLLDKEQLSFSQEALGYARLTKYFEEYQREINSLYVQSINFSKFDKRPPLEHQKAGVEFLLKNNRCILGDDMGLGKSITTVYAALSMEDRHKVLIVTLKTLKYNFAKEISYLDDRVTVVDKKWQEAKFTIVHYDGLKKWKNEIEKGKFSILILDEAHKVRNPKTQRTKFIMDFIKILPLVKIWLLTGTPIDNRPIDYFNLLKIIKHPISKDWRNYVERYCAATINRWGQWEVNGASNLEELHNLTQDTFLRRLKTNVGIDLPSKNRKPIFLELKNRKGYNQTIEDFKNKKYDQLVEEVGYEGNVEDVQVEQMTRLLLHRQFCALEKIHDGSLLELVDNILEENDTNKIIIFTNFRKVIDGVCEHYGSEMCSFIDGRILDSKKRLDIMDDFNENPKKRINAINIAAGGTGLNGQGANYVIVNDMEWRPTSMLQAEDRAWRIGQKRDVTVLYPIYDNTVEQVLYDTIERKMQIISTVVEGKEQQYFDDTIMEDPKEQEKEEKDELIKSILAQMGL